MKKINLKTAAEEFEMINAETHLYYNTETGEFDYYCDFMGEEDADPEKFEGDAWVAAPSQRDINEYEIMADFANTVTDPQKSVLLCVALEGRGAFRRFKDTLHRVGLEKEWYAFKNCVKRISRTRDWQIINGNIGKRSSGARRGDDLSWMR
jgi:hypothetical protein